jgi:hypothetical protein
MEKENLFVSHTPQNLFDIPSDSDFAAIALDDNEQRRTRQIEYE